MKALLLTVTMPSDSDGDYHHYWICATREAAIAKLREWVDRENSEMRAIGETGDCSACGAIGVEGEHVNQLTDNPVNPEDKSLSEIEDFYCWPCIDKVTDPVEAYFATSEDIYDITEYPVLGLAEATA